MIMGKSVLVKGRNQETARAVLAAAERAGYGPEVVRTSSQGGYLVPEEVAAELGKAPVSEEFETPSLETRLSGLAPDETPVSGPQDSPEGLEVVERSTAANQEGPVQTGPGREFEGLATGAPVSAAAAEADYLREGDAAEQGEAEAPDETLLSTDTSEDAEKENDPATRKANADAADEKDDEKADDAKGTAKASDKGDPKKTTGTRSSKAGEGKD